MAARREENEIAVAGQAEKIALLWLPIVMSFRYQLRNSNIRIEALGKGEQFPAFPLGGAAVGVM